MGGFACKPLLQHQQELSSLSVSDERLLLCLDFEGDTYYILLVIARKVLYDPF